jgi:glucose-6-phosphate isomerase
MLGSEFNKTYGHYHPLKDGTDFTYPEVYEVISGKALYLLQKLGKNEDEIEEAYLIEVNAGEKAIMPPNFGHITINPLAIPLVMSNWVAAEFSSEYELYEKNQGGGYYITKSQISNPSRSRRAEADLKSQKNPKSQTNPKFQIVKNEHYKILPKLIRARPKELPQLGLKFGKPMYTTGTRSINKLEYLIKPEKYTSAITPQSVFSLQSS